MKEAVMKTHPMVVFWLGLLTGAIFVGFLFFYEVLVSSDYESAVLKLNRTLVAPAVTTQMGGPGGNLTQQMGGPGGN